MTRSRLHRETILVIRISDKLTRKKASFLSFGQFREFVILLRFEQGIDYNLAIGTDVAISTLIPGTTSESGMTILKESMVHVGSENLPDC
jgi:hypothetical protein